MTVFSAANMADDADNVYFKKLLNMVPAHFHLSGEGKDTVQNTDPDGDQPAKKKRKGQNLLTPQTDGVSGNVQVIDSAREDKIRGKKESKQKKKKKQKEATGAKINIQEAQEKLRARIAELQAKRAQNLTSAEMQERKRLERKQRRLNARGKHKNKKKDEGSHGDSDAPATEPVPVTKATKPVVTKEGKLIFSKFDFTKSGEKEKTSDLAGKDYKRILARLEQREAKVAKLKETDAGAASKLEQKYVWQDVMKKAKGEKIKDDPTKLKKAIKRKEKMKESRKKKWESRKATEDKAQKDRQQKRQDNIQKRKDEKKAKHRKKLIKKGRILPGF